MNDSNLASPGPAAEKEGEWVRAFAPATVANVACGFDVLGFAVQDPGDVVAVRRRTETGVILSEVTGDGGRLPRDAARNTAGVAVEHLLGEVFGDASPGVELRLAKGLPLSSGLGSSAASSVAAVVAVDALLGLGAARRTLLAAAVEGERMATGTAHADNVAPALYGGLVLVRSGSRVTELPVPSGLACALLRPHVEIETGQARALLGDSVPLSAAVRQWGNLGAFVAGLFRADHELIASALHDAVAEPVRAAQVPGFDAVRAAAMDAGALGSGLSGSGPTVFALCRDRPTAEACGAAMKAALDRAVHVDGDVYISDLGAPGARVLYAADRIHAADLPGD